jgi:hypothetical protein
MTYGAHDGVWQKSLEWYAHGCCSVANTVEELIDRVIEVRG